MAEFPRPRDEFYHPGQGYKTKGADWTCGANRGPQSVTRESLDAEISAAKAWLDAHPATTGSGSGRVRYLSMENFRG